MTNALDAFAEDLVVRLDASARLGLESYGAPPPRFRSLEERADHLARGYARLERIILRDRVEAAKHPRVVSYGAWNPTVMFVGLTPGTQPLDIAREHEHVIGAPELFARWPGAKGNPWFPAEISDLTHRALVDLAALDPRMRELARVWPEQFARGARNACLMLNLREIPTASGETAPMELAEGTENLRRHLRAFRPRLLVAVSPKVASALGRMFDEDFSAPHGDEPTVHLGRVVETPIVTMPVHPNAKGTGIPRYQASKPRVARRLAEILSTRSP